MSAPVAVLQELRRQGVTAPVVDAVAELIEKARAGNAALQRHFDCACDGTEVRASLDLGYALARVDNTVFS